MMSEVKFTPAPWNTALPEDETKLIVIGTKEQGIALVGGKTFEHKLANAILIESAPEMYEALEKIAEIVQDIPLCPEVLKIISIYEKVTQKAQGGELSE